MILPIGQLTKGIRKAVVGRALKRMVGHVCNREKWRKVGMKVKERKYGKLLREGVEEGLDVVGERRGLSEFEKAKVGMMVEEVNRDMDYIM
jgi:ABC-type multidrug transport system fused ATPase/permease subunit